MNCSKEEHNDYISGCIFCEIENAAKREQERIIKLLESKICSCLGLPDGQTFCDREEQMKCAWDAMMIEYHVAIIKGEQK